MFVRSSGGEPVGAGGIFDLADSYAALSAADDPLLHLAALCA